jgi:hypothetical protein
MVLVEKIRQIPISCPWGLLFDTNCSGLRHKSFAFNFLMQAPTCHDVSEQAREERRKWDNCPHIPLYVNTRKFRQFPRFPPPFRHPNWLET